jgi:hypothetical protein
VDRSTTSVIFPTVVVCDILGGIVANEKLDSRSDSDQARRRALVLYVLIRTMPSPELVLHELVKLAPTKKKEAEAMAKASSARA